MTVRALCRDHRSVPTPLEIARRVADRPRIEVAGNVVRLRPPIDPEELRAVTVSYEVRVPRDTRVVVVTDSGAVAVDGVAAPVTVDDAVVGHRARAASTARPRSRRVG